MAIDVNLITRMTQNRRPSVFEEALSMSQLVNQSKMSRMQLRSAERQEREQLKLSELYKQNQSPTVEQVSAISPEAGQRWALTIEQIRKAKVDVTNAELDRTIKGLEIKAKEAGLTETEKKILDQEVATKIKERQLNAPERVSGFTNAAGEQVSEYIMPDGTPKTQVLGTSFDKTKFDADEDNKRADRSYRAENDDANREVTMRGQDLGAQNRLPRDNSALVQAVLANPALYDNLTPTAKTAIAPELAKAGFEGFGRQLTESAISKMSDSRSAVASLKDLRDVLQKNEQYIGPLAGFQALSPYSEARKAQADIDRVKQRVGKTLEGGVLRKEDEEKYKKILATLSDTPSTAIYKVDQMIEEMGRDLEIFIEEQRKAGRKVNNNATPAGGDPLGILK